MIRRWLRRGFRLGLVTAIGVGVAKLVQGRRSAAQLGRPSDDWATPPTPPPAPRAAPEPELVKPVMLEEIIEKKSVPAAELPTDAAPPEPPPAPGASVVKKAPPAKRAARKPVEPAAPQVAAGTVKKAPPTKKAAPSPDSLAPAAEDARRLSEARKAAPVKKAAKKQP